MNEADDDLATFLQGDGDAEMRHAVEEIDRSVDGVDHPLVFRVGVAGIPFFTEHSVFREGSQQSFFQKSLRLPVECQLDVVGEFFVHFEGSSEGAAQSEAGFKRAFFGNGKKCFVSIDR